MKKLLKKLSDKLSVDGYNPLNGFNIFLSILSGLALGLFIVGICTESSGDIGHIPLIVGIVCFLFLLFRNRKLKKIPQIIIISVVSTLVGAVLGILIIIVAAFLLWLGGWGNPEKSSDGQSSDESSGNNWSKQYSQSKGEYSTDGQGNFKDQYGNDVYNPQGVSDYDKL
ncbi:MAG: hypothetical protein NC254_05060 [bacterium]|nr:hypothetical protein [bacterium]